MLCNVNKISGKIWPERLVIYEKWLQKGLGWDMYH